MSKNKTIPTEKDVTPRTALLQEAAYLIDGDRNEEYGPPVINFTNIAKLWNVRFAHMLKSNAEFTPEDVAEAMILVKVARNVTGVKRDTYVDIAGYAGCAWEISQAERL